MAKRPPIPYLAEYQRLKHEFPHLERDELLRRAGWSPSGIMPTWADSNRLKESFYRRDPRDAKKGS